MIKKWDDKKILIVNTIICDMMAMHEGLYRKAKQQKDKEGMLQNGGSYLTLKNLITRLSFYSPEFKELEEVERKKIAYQLEKEITR